MPHIHEKYDFTITLFILFEAKVLLVNHPRYNKWIPVGGHIELDEDPEQAIYREAAEETGLEIELLTTKPDVKSAGTRFMPTPNYMDVHEANSPHKHISLIYFARAKSRDYKLSEEHTELKWFTAEEVQDIKYDLSPAVKFYCQIALELE